MKDLAVLLGRLLIVAVFAGAAAEMIADFEATRQRLAAEMVPSPALALVGAIVVLAVGSLTVFAGLLTRLGCVLLGLFVIAATYYFHVPGLLDGTVEEQAEQRIAVMKNAAILAGLLALFGGGPGRFSLDGRDGEDARAGEL